jgi:hypothetical protein
VTIAGIDFSSRAVDIVLLDEESDAASWHRFELDFLPGQDAFDRTRNVVAVVPRGSFWDDVLAVGIEEPRGYGAGSLYRIQGAILACIPVLKLVQPWIPSAWRKAITLKGNATKDDVATYARRDWPGDHPLPERIDWPQDACDAYCIALATRTMLHRTEAAA